MSQKFKTALRILVGIVLAVQLSGCIFVHDRQRREERHDNKPGFDIRVHGE